MTRIFFSLVVLFGFAISAAAQKPSAYDSKVQDPAIQAVVKDNAGQDAALRTLVRNNDSQDAALRTLVRDVDALKNAPTPVPAPTPAPAPAPTIPAGTATRRWTNANFASLPADVDFATFYIAAGLNETQARTRLAEVLNGLRKAGRPVFLEIAMAVMADAIAVARQNVAPTDSQILAAVQPSLDAKADAAVVNGLVAVVGTPAADDKPATGLVADVAALKTADQKAAECFNSILAALQNVGRPATEDAPATGVFQRLDAVETGLATKADSAEVARVATSVANLETTVAAQEAVLGDTVARIDTLESAFASVAEALATLDPEKTSEKKRIRAAAAAALDSITP